MIQTLGLVFISYKRVSLPSQEKLSDKSKKGPSSPNKKNKQGQSAPSSPPILFSDQEIERVTAQIKTLQIQYRETQDDRKRLLEKIADQTKTMKQLLIEQAAEDMIEENTGLKHEVATLAARNEKLKTQAAEEVAAEETRIKEIQALKTQAAEEVAEEKTRTEAIREACF